jgi:hypothetical protein
MKFEIVKHSNDYGDVTYRAYTLNEYNGTRLGTVGIGSSYESAVEQARVYKLKATNRQELIEVIDI